MHEGKTILIVDDEDGIRRGLEDFLSLSGFEVRAAQNGMEALATLEEVIPDLIIADIMMPRMNGYQFYNRVRKNPEWVWIPFIFLTAKGGDEDVRYGKELGVDDYLQKPIEPEDLIAVVLGRLNRYQEFEATLNPEVVADIGAGFGRASVDPLTKREQEVLRLVVEGLNNVEIAKRLFIGRSTVKSHVSNILSKLGVNNRVEAVKIAFQMGLYEQE